MMASAFPIWGFERITTRGWRVDRAQRTRKTGLAPVVSARIGKEIGQILGISHRTVKVRIASHR